MIQIREYKAGDVIFMTVHSEWNRSWFVFLALEDSYTTCGAVRCDDALILARSPNYYDINDRTSLKAEFAIWECYKVN